MGGGKDNRLFGGGYSVVPDATGTRAATDDLLSDLSHNPPTNSKAQSSVSRSTRDMLFGDDDSGSGVTDTVFRDILAPSGTTSTANKKTISLATAESIQKQKAAYSKFNKNDNTDNSKDDQLSDLAVGQMMQREDELDVATFGKSNVRQGEGGGRGLSQETANAQAAAKDRAVLQREQAEMDRLDSLLNSSTTDSALESKKKTTTAAPAAASSTAPSADAPDIDFAALDLDSYIAAESSAGGGLFD